jgi:hypothetical protein
VRMTDRADLADRRRATRVRTELFPNFWGTNERIEPQHKPNETEPHWLSFRCGRHLTGGPGCPGGALPSVEPQTPVNLPEVSVPWKGEE